VNVCKRGKGTKGKLEGILWTSEVSEDLWKWERCISELESERVKVIVM
jgi:hypothetical protein